VSSAGDDVVGWSDDGVEQGDEADEGRLEAGRGIIVGCCTLGRHRGRLEKVAPFAAYPRCSTDKRTLRPAWLSTTTDRRRIATARLAEEGGPLNGTGRLNETAVSIRQRCAFEQVSLYGAAGGRILTSTA
jgi:hypothetical protein